MAVTLKTRKAPILRVLCIAKRRAFRIEQRHLAIISSLRYILANADNDPSCGLLQCSHKLRRNFADMTK